MVPRSPGFLTAFLLVVLLRASVCGGVLGDDTYQTVVAPFLKRHCLGCHGGKSPKGELALDSLASAAVTPRDAEAFNNAEQWGEILDQLNLGQMPPPGEPRPDPRQQRAVSGWIATRLRSWRQSPAAADGRRLLRRLTRVEYANTVRDLLGLDFLPGDSPAEQLPPDARWEGFDKVSSALMIDASLLERYYEVAQSVADRCLVNGPPKYPTHKSHFEIEDMRLAGSGFSYVCGHSGTVCSDHDVRLLNGSTRTARGLLYPGTNQLIPVKGRYTIRVRAAAHQGEAGEPVRMYVERQNGREGWLMDVKVTATRDAPKVYSVTLPLDELREARGVYLKVGIVNGTKLHEGLVDYNAFERAVDDASKQGDHAQALRLQARMRSEGWVGRNRPADVLLQPEKLPQLFIDWVEIEGPLYPQWPPRSHQQLLFRGAGAAETDEYTRAIFARFLPRALRRPASDAEVERVVRLVRDERKRGASFLDAVKLGISYTLSSPAFLYLVEPGVGEQPRKLDDFEFASRLSYFLWSSMPDTALFELAEAGTLQHPQVLRRTVERMLADPKAESLVTVFAAQWLKTAEFLEFTPDPQIYPDFEPPLREWMAAEALAFFREVLQSDLSVLNFLDSNFVMVNEPLARFYGLPAVQGDAFRRVELPPDSPRGGVLGMAGVHLRGSDGLRTKPVNRGVYVREVLLNDPPDPPPPNAGEVEPNVAGKRLTVRQRLMQHQQIEACADCHRGIDPYGLALENFDVTGRWRERQNGEAFRGSRTPLIDASGRLPDGRAFADFREFKQRLRERPARFRRALVEKLFLYALGRPAAAGDREAIAGIVDALPGAGDTLRAAIQALVQSEPFAVK